MYEMKQYTRRERDIRTQWAADDDDDHHHDEAAAVVVAGAVDDYDEIVCACTLFCLFIMLEPEQIAFNVRFYFVDAFFGVSKTKT